ncbi:uncharacterized protein EI97DRAFT_118539 [Westerdykella ornata]|uniref:Rhodopsin domain-containing protein n=1 Tax=Westerdykella ornata TaxID=318751 RepID=A0A6A6JW40_WESOR|nr:uncharacterized protein EI97DRAFT_118539 [Westerdykella ornata]KAF2280313.1 hypothetical protein EI97DRAFT_118539 [Westerdykella ornata]
MAAVHARLAVVLAFTLTSLSTVVVALRYVNCNHVHAKPRRRGSPFSSFYCRYGLLRKLSPSDWVMLFALLSTWGTTVTNYYQIHFMDYSKVNSEQSYMVVVVGNLLSFWVYRLFYILNLCLIKISILLFYKYITSVRKSFHLLVKILLIVVISCSIGMFIASILVCNPPSDAWSYDVFMMPFYGRWPTQCYNPLYIWFSTASFHLLTDLVVWFLPIPFFLNLQSMPLKRRLGLAGIFSIGIVAIAASAVRLWVLKQWALDGFEKQGERAADLLIWGQVEQHAGIIAASIPFLRPLVKKVVGLPKHVVVARRKGREGQSPSPAAKLMAQNHAAGGGGFGFGGHEGGGGAAFVGTPERDSTPVPHRTPIIPSPSATYASEAREREGETFKMPVTPLSPVFPVDGKGPEVRDGEV